MAAGVGETVGLGWDFLPIIQGAAVCSIIRLANASIPIVHTDAGSVSRASSPRRHYASCVSAGAYVWRWRARVVHRACLDCIDLGAAI